MLRWTSLIVILLVGFITESNATTCLYGSLTSSNQCTCLSGYTGTTCNTTQLGTCTLAPPQPLQTTPIGEFISGSVSNSALSFQVVSPATNSRYFNYIQFSSASNCSYPGPNFVKGFQQSNCSDTYSASIPFASIANECNFVFSTDPSYEYYDGVLSLNAIENVTSPAGIAYTRSIVSSLLLQLILPKNFNVNTTDVLQSYPINIDPVVTQQVYNRTTDSLIFSISTQIAHLYTLKAGASIISFPTTFSGYSGTTQSSSISTICSNLNVPCSQVTTFTVSNIIANGICNLNGNFQVEWNFNCQAGSEGCPYSSGNPDPQVNTTITLASSDLCGKLKIQAHLSGQLSSYSDSSLSSTQATFTTGYPIYYQLSTTSDVSIQSISFSSIQIQDMDNPTTLLTLFDGTSNTTYGVTSGLFIYPQSSSSPSLIAFSLAPSASLLNRSPLATINFGIFATAQVTYVTTFGKRRDIVTRTMKFEKSNTLLPRSGLLQNHQQQSDSSQSLVQFSSDQFVLEEKGLSLSSKEAMFVFGFLLMALFALRRRISRVFVGYFQNK